MSSTSTAKETEMTVIAKSRKVASSRAHQTGNTPAAGTSETPVLVEPAGRDVLVPLERLFISEANVRKVHHEEGLVELAALIDAQGLLQRLCVVAQPDERFAVVAGGRRLRAMQVLAQSGRWPASHPVECKLYAQSQALQVSLAENSGREGMHPADQMEAFKRLIDHENLTVAQVASRFGVSPLTVERRLKLARLSPRFLDMYRADEIEPDQLQALALIESHATQEAVWDGLGPFDRSAWRIRTAMTSEACSADSRLARFVGLAAYEAAGGTVRRDLFTSMDDLSVSTWTVRTCCRRWRWTSCAATRRWSGKKVGPGWSARSTPRHPHGAGTGANERASASRRRKKPRRSSDSKPSSARVPMRTTSTRRRATRTRTISS
jgi:ParB family chromosome partitioning protein